MAKQRVLVTGPTGVIGTAVRELMSDKYDLHYITHRPADFESTVADVADLDAILPAFEGMDAVVHLAGSSSVQSSWEDVLHSNLIGTYNVYEAARRQNVPAVVFASSNHAIGRYELDGMPELYNLDDPRVFDNSVPVRPDSLYGVSKVYGEALGRYYHETYGMRVYCLRIGSVIAGDDPRAKAIGQGSSWLDLTVQQKYARLRATWLSKRDCCNLIACCLESKTVPWAVVYGISDNPRQFWDLSSARALLGYHPIDSAPE
jgi:nucleoside-diphosphate-sugar epimerase